MFSVCSLLQNKALSDRTQWGNAFLYLPIRLDQLYKLCFREEDIIHDLILFWQFGGRRIESGYAGWRVLH